MPIHQLETEIEIEASPERIWAILADFDVYPKWNPFIRFVRGLPEKGSRLEVRLQPSGARGMTFRPTVVSAEPGRELRWLGHLLVPGLFDGEHGFSIESVANGKALFRQNERFGGLLVPLFRSGLDRDTKRGFEEMNRALKARAEGKGAVGGQMPS